MARPRRDPAVPPASRLAVGFHPDELARIQAAAAAEHLPVATWLRRAAFAALELRKE